MRRRTPIGRRLTWIPRWPQPTTTWPGPSKRLPERWRLRAWATILETQGHQLPRIHPSAWLSGVYYVPLPATVRTGPEDDAGAIEFRRPPEDLELSEEPPVRLVRPEEGLLVLFPSFFYRRTLPFIRIAFDVIPEQP